MPYPEAVQKKKPMSKEAKAKMQERDTMRERYAEGVKEGFADGVAAACELLLKNPRLGFKTASGMPFSHDIVTRIKKDLKVD